MENLGVISVLLLIGWYATFILLPFGNTSLGLLILLPTVIVELSRQMKQRKQGALSLNVPPAISRINKLFILLIAIACFSIIFSPKPLMALPVTIGFCLMLLVFFYGPQKIKNPNDFIQKYFPVMFFSSIVAMIYSLTSFFLLHFPRAKALFAGENKLGTLLILVSGTVTGYLIWRGGRWKYLTIPYLGITIATLLASQSRGAWLGFVAMIGCFTFFNKKFLIIALVIVLLAGAVILISPNLNIRFMSIFSLQKNDVRVSIWKVTLKMIEDHPFIGVGAGVYPFVYESYPHNVPDVSYAHNLFLQVAAEFGLVGLLIFISLLGYVLYVSFSLAKTKNPLYIGLFASLIGVLVHQQFDLPIWGIEIGGAFWMLVALILNCYCHEWYEGKLKSSPQTVKIDA